MPPCSFFVGTVFVCTSTQVNSSQPFVDQVVAQVLWFKLVRGVMGIRQRLSLDDRANQRKKASGGGTVLKNFFKKGKVSAFDVQKAATTIRDGGDQSADIASFSKASVNGKDNKHVSRDVIRKMLKGNSSPPLYIT